MNKKIDNIHTSAYLTIMSIVQGAAFSYLLFYSFENFDKIAGQNIVFKSFVAWISIVFIWHEYVLAVTFYTWFYRLLDSFTPFAVGVSEVIMIYTIKLSDKYWYASLAFLSAVVFLATVNMHWKVSEDGENADIYFETKKYFIASEIIFIVSFLTMISLYKLAENNTKFYVDYEMVFKTLPLAILFIIGIRTRLFTNTCLSVMSRADRS